MTQLVQFGTAVVTCGDLVYLAHGVLGSRFYNDMLHIALATVAEVDVLVS